ncbi:CRISPR-associated endonuclease Cas2 [Endothiovibrio diazotrophicus]
MHLYLVCFDISDDRDRNRAGKRLLRHGERVQESVFEVSLRDDVALERLREELRPLVDRDDDLRFYHLCAQCRERSSDLDGGRVAHYPAAVIL